MSARPTLTTGISSEPLRPAELLEDLGEMRDGGLVLFVGRVREWNESRRVRGLHYEAYREMAELELERIVADVSQRTAVGAIAAVHRVGDLVPGDPSVAVAVAAPHRAAAYEASRAVIEEIKARLPIWKRETYVDGTVRWLGSPPDGSEPGASTPGGRAEASAPGAPSSGT